METRIGCPEIKPLHLLHEIQQLWPPFGLDRLARQHAFGSGQVEAENMPSVWMQVGNADCIRAGVERAHGDAEAPLPNFGDPSVDILKHMGVRIGGLERPWQAVGERLRARRPAL